MSFPRCLLKLGLLLTLATSRADQNPKIPLITMNIIPSTLRFATTQFEVTAGTRVDLKLNNGCVMPHNWVLGLPGKADVLVNEATAMGADGPAHDFVPQTPNVVAATHLLSPGSSQTLELHIPKDPGDYPYLCTFPGHGTIMRGIMRVRAKGEKLGKPVTEAYKDTRTVDALKASGVNSQPMGTREHPLILRTIAPNPALEDAVLSQHGVGLPAKTYNPTTGKEDDKLIEPSAGIPGAIGVNFGADFSYVWDTTECRLLYAWKGGFLDMTPDWGKGHGGSRKAMDYVPRIMGTIVYQATGPLPLQLAKPQKPKFLGFSLHDGIPEFEYQLGGKTIREQITPSGENSFTCQYRIENPPDPVRLSIDENQRPQWSCEQGGWAGNTLEIPADHADLFQITLKFLPGRTFQALNPAELNKSNESAQP